MTTPAFPLNDSGVRLALEIATHAHEGQFRKDGVTPYITHPVAVAEAIWKTRNRTLFSTLGVVALLHDVLEDTSVTPQYLLDQGVGVVNIEEIKLLTHNKNVPYLDYILSVRRIPTTRWIKIADIRHNLSTSTGTMKDKYELALYVLRFGK